MTNNLDHFWHNYLTVLTTLAHAPFVVFIFVLVFAASLTCAWLDSLEDRDR